MKLVARDALVLSMPSVQADLCPSFFADVLESNRLH